MMLSRPDRRWFYSRPDRRWLYVCVGCTILALITVKIFSPPVWVFLWMFPLFPMMIDYIKQEGFFAEEE